MAAEAAQSRDELVLVLAPTGRDMALACALLRERAGIVCEACTDVADLCAEIRLGAGAALIAEEAIDDAGARKLVDTLSAQLPWSDLPILIPTEGESETGMSACSSLRQSGNVTLLSRPARILTLITAIQSALRARRRQYEVRDLLAETRAAVRHRDQFLAMLGHELRNPLAAITNAMNVLDVASPPADEIEREHTAIVRRQTENLARLVDDLLDVSRITSGKISLQMKPTDLCELVRRTVQGIDGAARAQRHTVSLTGSRNPIFVDADPLRMEQVINNLLTNAIKYTPPGGHIDVRVDVEDGDRAVVRVIDDGMGMAPELLPRVFDLFTQAEGALDRSQGGLGIGLTLVRALVEMHGGSVKVESPGPGKGCRFTVTLPRILAPQRQAAAAPPPRTAAPAAPAGPRGRRILLVEDQPDSRRALQRLLQIWGHTVESAEDGVIGLERELHFAPEIALIDVGLPGLDGYEVARQIRARHGNGVRLVALTGYGQPEDRERAFAAGFDVHLVKPVDRDQLKQALSDSAMMYAHDEAGQD